MVPAELCKKLKFAHINKWYMHKPESVLKNGTKKILWDFPTRTDHLIPARRPDLPMVNKNKRNCRIVDFAVPLDNRGKTKENIKRNKILNLSRELNNLWNMKRTLVSFVICTLGTFPGGTGRVSNQRTSENHPNYSVVYVRQNTEKNPRNLRRLTVGQTPVKGYQLTMVWKILKEIR